MSTTTDNLKRIFAAEPLRTVSWLQGLYYLAAGLWPLLDISSFQAVTGPKNDLWLVRTVGLLLIVCGVALLSSAFRGILEPETVVIGVGTALVISAIDFVYVTKGIISPIYLLDAAAEIGIAAAWVGGGYGKLSARRGKVRE